MDKIEALVKVSARLGMFDQLAKGMLEFAPSTVRFDIHNVNYEDPTGDDAILVFRVGLGLCDVPHLSEFINGAWRMRSYDMRVEMYKQASIKLGLEALSKHIEERSKNAIRKEPH